MKEVERDWCEDGLVFSVEDGEIEDGCSISMTCGAIVNFKHVVNIYLMCVGHDSAHFARIL